MYQIHSWGILEQRHVALWKNKHNALSGRQGSLPSFAINTRSKRLLSPYCPPYLGALAAFDLEPCLSILVSVLNLSIVALLQMLICQI
jgi:hypothetical protein